jgi:CheY-like chemotaxis protein
MKRILLVDDDPLMLRIYGDGLRRRGFEVESAEDGLAAARALQKTAPDAIVLDLMMPKLSGVEVLKYVRGRSELAKIPVVVLTNGLMQDLVGQAEAAGANEALSKAACTPDIMAKTLNRLLDGAEAAPADHAADASSGPPKAVSAESEPAAAKGREDFKREGPAALAALGGLFLAFHKARDDGERAARLDSLYTKIHLLAGAARVGECHRLSLLAGALEALLHELSAQPARISPSVLRTTSRPPRVLNPRPNPWRWCLMTTRSAGTSWSRLCARLTSPPKARVTPWLPCRGWPRNITA